MFTQEEETQKKEEIELKKNTKEKSALREYTEAILIAFAVALFVRTFVVQAFKIPSGSMLPTLQVGDYLLVNKFIYGIKIPFKHTTLIPLSSPKRGDVIVFRYPENEKLDYIKRVVATPGDKLEVRAKQLYINGQEAEDNRSWLEKPNEILPKTESSRDNFGPIIVPEGKFFVMGDNRDNSYDSRFWGYVKEDQLVGKAFILYWSWDLHAPLLSAKRWTSIRWKRLGDIIK